MRSFKRLVVVVTLGGTLVLLTLGLQVTAQCVDFSQDPAGCQPSAFRTPFGQIPTSRVNRDGKIDPFSSPEDAKAGAFKLERDLHLFRNMEHLHWVTTIPSVKDETTGKWKGGDLDGEGDARGLGIAGNCIFVGHRNGRGTRHPINIFKIQANPEKDAPVQVGEIPANAAGNEGFDGRELRSLVYTTSRGEGRYLLVRNGGTNNEGWMDGWMDGNVSHRYEYVPARL